MQQTTKETGARLGASSAGEMKTRWGAYTPKELDDMGTPEWLIPDVLPKECAGVVWGKSGALKTFFVLGMACAINTGTDWYGHAVTQGAVLYVAAEGFRGIRQRQRAWEIAHGVKLRDTFRVVEGRVNLQDETEVAAFIAWVKDTLPDVRLIVFDTLSKCMPTLKDENGNADMARVVAGAEAIKQELHTAVVLIAHSDKMGRNLRGGSALEFGTSPRIKLTKDDAGVKVVCENQKDADEFESFTLTPQKVDLGEQYPDGSLVLVGATEMASSAGKVTRHSKDTPARRNSRQRVTKARVYAAVGKAGQPVSPADVRKVVGGSRQTVQNHLTRLCEDGLVVNVGGKYCLAPSQNVYAA